MYYLIGYILAVLVGGKLVFGKKRQPRHFTFWIIPHTSKSPKSLRVPFWAVFTGGACCLIFFVAVFGMSFYLLNVIDDFRNLAAIKEINRRQAGEIQKLGESIRGLHDRIEGLDEREEEIRRLMGLNPNPDKLSGSKDTSGDVDNSFASENSSTLNVGQGGPVSPDLIDFISVSRGVNDSRDRMLLGHANSDQIKREIASFTSVLEAYEDSFEVIKTEVEENVTYYRSLPNYIPVDGNLTSLFGMRTSPFGQKKEMHSGIDLSAPSGSPVKAAGDGLVTYSGYKPVLGYTIEIDHGNGMETIYLHNSKLIAKVGESVEKGQTIALVGSTGRSTGPHLHFSLKKDGQLIDPLVLLESSKG